jgi:hypothetical protein
VSLFVLYKSAGLKKSCVFKIFVFLFCSLTAWRSSKARDTYGPIVELVKKQQEVAKKTGLPASYAGANLAITNKSGQNKLDSE